MLKQAKFICLLAAIAISAGCSTLYNYVGGNFAGSPAELDSKVSDVAKGLIVDARAGMVAGAPFDHHFHILGLGTGLQRLCPEIPPVKVAEPIPGALDSAVWLNPDYTTWRHPLLRLKLGVFMSAAGVRDLDDADAQYIERVLHLARYAGGTFYMYAMDWHYEGAPQNAISNRSKTDLYIGNQHVIAMTACLNRAAGRQAAFVPVASIHPYKRGAIEELHKAADAGIRYLKWLPPAQGIDPANRDLTPFYEAMRERRVVLLSHTGSEHTFRVGAGLQDLADPIRLSLPAKLGVTVVMLHSGRDGREEKAWPEDGLRLDYFDRFVAMMKQHQHGVFGEISAVPYLRTHRRLEALLADDNIRCRLIDGTDYPNPAISIINPTAMLLNAGYLGRQGEITKTEARARKRALDEIYSYNPLLFDFVMKRTIRVGGNAIPPAAFYDLDTKVRNPNLGC